MSRQSGFQEVPYEASPSLFACCSRSGPFAAVPLPGGVSCRCECAGSTYTSRSPGGRPETAANAPVIKVQSNLVLVDVVVTKNGVPVKGLTSDKFRVLENGKQQELKVFEVHTEEQQRATAGNAPAPKAPELAPNNYSDFSPYPPSSAVNVLLLDALNTPSTDQALRPEAGAGIPQEDPSGNADGGLYFVLSQLRMIQGFTADASLLAKADYRQGRHQAVDPRGRKEHGRSVVVDAASEDT